MAKKRTEPTNPWPAKFKALRERLGLETYPQLAERLGVSMETLRSWLYRGSLPSLMARKFIDELLKNDS